MSDEKASAWTDEERVAMAAQKRVDSKDAYEPCHACDGSGFMRLRTSDAYPGCGHPEVKPGCMTCDPRPAEASPEPNGPLMTGTAFERWMKDGDTDGLVIVTRDEWHRRERDQPGPLPVRSTLGVPDWFLHSLAGVLRYPLDSSAETLLLAADRLWVQQTSGDGATESLQTEASVTTTTPAGGPGEAGTTSSTPNACKTSGEPGGGVVASVAPSSPLPVREPEEAGTTNAPCETCEGTCYCLRREALPGSLAWAEDEIRREQLTPEKVTELLEQGREVRRSIEADYARMRVKDTVLEPIKDMSFTSTPNARAVPPVIRWETQALNAKGMCGDIIGSKPNERACILPIDHQGQHGWDHEEWKEATVQTFAVAPTPSEAFLSGFNAGVFSGTNEVPYDVNEAFATYLQHGGKTCGSDSQSSTSGPPSSASLQRSSCDGSLPSSCDPGETADLETVSKVYRNGVRDGRRETYLEAAAFVDELAKGYASDPAQVRCRHVARELRARAGSLFTSDPRGGK
jgi:hypothetical protein